MIRRDLVQPCTEGIVERVRWQGAESLDEALLNKVVDLTRTTNHARDVPLQRIGILGNEFCVGRLVPSKRPFDEPPVLFAGSRRGFVLLIIGHAGLAI